ncbi:trypsin-like peptidase domain-containing protein [Micromonospora sp. DT227]|uniref:trypsin-like peptidase domain-containing protein n=1 Tax=Micromonospora sp. DT227 TaxID=3393433 RepID=UPI003CF3A7DD
MITLARPSVASLFLEMRVRDEFLASGTGFVVIHGDQPYLITNRHNLSGRSSDTNEPRHSSAATPDSVAIMHNSKTGLGNWVKRFEPVVNAEGEPLWLEHPRFGRQVDVVALPLRNLDGVELYPHQLEDNGPEVSAGISEGVNIIGFPFGLTGGGVLGIWSRGFIATEPDIDFNDLPLFLIDSRTRPGQSGSPVIAYFDGGMVRLKDGGSAMFSGPPIEKLLGVYSGRINSQSDLGFVWRTSAVKEILAKSG